MKQTHSLKIEIAYFEDIKTKRKRFEIRKDDRDFQIGDHLELVCGLEKILVKIIYKTTYHQERGYCVLGISDIIAKATYPTVAYTINGKQPVTCTYIGDQPLHYLEDED